MHDLWGSRIGSCGVKKTPRRWRDGYTKGMMTFEMIACQVAYGGVCVFAIRSITA